MDKNQKGLRGREQYPMQGATLKSREKSNLKSNLMELQ